MRWLIRMNLLTAGFFVGFWIQKPAAPTPQNSLRIIIVGIDRQLSIDPSPVCDVENLPLVSAVNGSLLYPNKECDCKTTGTVFGLMAAKVANNRCRSQSFDDPPHRALKREDRKPTPAIHPL